MTIQPIASRFEQRSLSGIVMGAVTASMLGLLCHSVRDLQPAAGSITGAGLLLPAAIDYALQSRRRDTSSEIDRIRQGDLSRPVVLVVPMLAAGLLLTDALYQLTAPTFVCVKPTSGASSAVGIGHLVERGGVQAFAFIMFVIAFFYIGS
jgi:hypothetical protein